VIVIIVSPTPCLMSPTPCLMSPTPCPTPLTPWAWHDERHPSTILCHPSTTLCHPSTTLCHHSTTLCHHSTCPHTFLGKAIVGKGDSGRGHRGAGCCSILSTCECDAHMFCDVGALVAEAPLRLKSMCVAERLRLKSMCAMTLERGWCSVGREGSLGLGNQESH